MRGTHGNREPHTGKVKLGLVEEKDAHTAVGVVVVVVVVFTLAFCAIGLKIESREWRSRL